MVDGFSLFSAQKSTKQRAMSSWIPPNAHLGPMSIAIGLCHRVSWNLRSLLSGIRSFLKRIR